MLALAALIAHVQEQCTPAEVEVVQIGVEQNTLPQAEWRWTGDPCRPRPTLRLTGWRDGDLIASYTVRPTLSIRVWGPVVAKDTPVGGQVSVEQGLIELPSPPLADPSKRLSARRKLRAGTPLSRLVVEPMPDAPAGTAVTLVTRRGSLEITAPGELLRDAFTGDQVRVLNRAQGVPLSGVLLTPKLVEIQ